MNRKENILADRKTMPNLVSGFTLIEMMAATAIFLFVFLALAQVFSMSIALVTAVKAKTGAMTLGEERLEFVKNLSYQDVGTQGGIPSGNIPQVEAVTLNSVPYERRTLIKYMDNPSDGLGASDGNGITADYKKVKVTISWPKKNGGRGSEFFVTNVAPRGIETLAGGGTLRIQTIDATANPVPGATVRIQNSTLSPAVDVTVLSNLSGEVIFPGSPAGSSYKITVSKSGYSTAGTYDVSAENPHPSPGNLTVVQGDVTTVSFKIDTLGSMKVHTFLAYADTLWEDSFDDTSEIATSSGVSVSGGSLTLKSAGAQFLPDGTFTTTSIAPDYLAHWSALSATTSKPTGTNILYHLYYQDGASFALIPDSALPGNTTGLSTPVDLSTLSVEKYRVLRVEGELTTVAPTSTPSLSSLSLSYMGGPVSKNNVSFSLRGGKTIGQTAGGDPIYKFATTSDTGSDGTYDFPSLEWDNYSFSTATSTGYVIAGTCPGLPLSLTPGEAMVANVILATSTANSLSVSVSDPVGNPLPGATVTLSGGGAPRVERSTTCGSVFFSGLSSGNYDVTVEAAAYASSTVTAIPVSGQAHIDVNMSS